MPDVVASPEALAAPLVTAAPQVAAAPHACCSAPEGADGKEDAEKAPAPEFLGMPGLPAAPVPAVPVATAGSCYSTEAAVPAAPVATAGSCCSTDATPGAGQAPEFLGLPSLPAAVGQPGAPEGAVPGAKASQGTDEAADVEHLAAIAATVNDPEIPVLSIKDLGILRGVRQEAGEVVVTITPTYSGCPAMDTIADDLRIAFQDAGYPGARIELTLSPAWTTDWMSQKGKAKLVEYGIAPPSPRREGDRLRLAMTVKCPRCHSLDTRELSRFGSTSCKALYQCNACQEPFDFFKAL